MNLMAVSLYLLSTTWKLQQEGKWKGYLISIKGYKRGTFLPKMVYKRITVWTPQAKNWSQIIILWQLFVRCCSQWTEKGEKKIYELVVTSYTGGIWETVRISGKILVTPLIRFLFRINSSKAKLKWLSLYFLGFFSHFWNLFIVSNLTVQSYRYS